MKKLAAAGSAAWFALSAAAARAEDTFGGNLLKNVGDKSYGPGAKTDVAVIVGNIIKIGISLVGVIFLVLSVYAGYLWMTARGDKESVQKAKDTLQRGIIGIIIVAAAYALSSFVISRLTTAVTG